MWRSCTDFTEQEFEALCQELDAICEEIEEEEVVDWAADLRKALGVEDE